MAEDDGKRVILKSSEGNKKPGALGDSICSISKRESFSNKQSTLQYQNVKLAEALTMG